MFGAILYIATALAMRVTILLPGLFLTGFYNQRYKTLMRMKEQYVFKKTVASAIPGFKEEAADEEAGDHVKAMTAAAFERLLFNPQEEVSRDLTAPHGGGRLSRWLRRIVREEISDAFKNIPGSKN